MRPFEYRTRVIISHGLYFFNPIFTLAAAYIADNLCTKNGNSSFFKLKIRARRVIGNAAQWWCWHELQPHNNTTPNGVTSSLALGTLAQSNVANIHLVATKKPFKYLTFKTAKYRTRAIIIRGLYFFLPHFSLRFILQRG